MMTGEPSRDSVSTAAAATGPLPVASRPLQPPQISSRSRRITALRVASQAAFTTLFVGLLIGASVAGAEAVLTNRFFFAIDPLLALTESLATRTVVVGAAIALVPLALTLGVGRFFCGWVCPMGAINHVVSWSAFRMGHRPAGIDRRWLKVKYLLLAAVVVMAAGGSRMGTLLDPVALLNRSLSTFVLPATGVFVNPWSLPPAEESPTPDEPRPQLLQAAAVPSPPPPSRLVAHATGIGVLFVAIVLLNLHRRRLFCNALCPLGAMYGLAARFSLLRVRTGDSCAECGTCAQGCPSQDGPSGEHASQDCLLCLNCVDDCPVGAAELRPATAADPPAVPFDVGRRKVFASVAAGLGFTAMAALAPEGRARDRRFLRPPGALAEAEFLSRCIRCGQCAQACPTGFIQPAGLETGPDGLWTPVVSAAVGYCAWACNQCTRVCPTGALQPLPLAEKRAFKIGTAVVDRSRCYTWADGMNCTACADRCPVPGNAIRFQEGAVWSFAGERVIVKRIHVTSDLCTGCGICEHACPRFDAPGIVVGCGDERRENAFESLVRTG